MSNFKPVPGSIPGTKLNLGGVEFVMPPLNLNQARQHEDAIKNLGQKATLSENMEDALPIIHAALSRNYPDLVLEDLRALIDIGNFRQATEALATSSGFVPAKPGESAPASP